MENNHYSELVNRLDLIDKKLNAIYQIINTKETPKPTPAMTSDGNIYKNSINFESFLNAIQDDKARTIVQDMYMNKYPTVTPGQFKLLKDIANKAKFSL